MKFIVIFLLFAAWLFHAPPVHAAELSNQFTLEMWVKPETSAASKAILGKAEEVRMFTDASGYPACQFKTTTWQTAATSGTALSLNTWAHVACVYNKTTLKLYVDGVEKASTALTSAVDDTANAYKLGQDDSSGTTYTNFIGSVDRFLVYNYARSGKQIVQDMNAGHPAVGSPVGSALAYYKFDEGQGSTANNSGNGGSSLSGTITSGTWNNTGRFGKALTFSASSSVTTTITDPGYSNTVSVWVNPSASVASKTLVTASKLTTSSLSKPVYGGCTGTALTLNTWTHIVAVSDGSGSCKIYQNGVQTASSTTGVTFGTSINIGASSFVGDVDDFKFYNYPLSAEEVKLDYNQGASMVLGRSSASSTAETAIYSDNFDRSASSGLGGSWTGSTWSTSSNKAINTPVTLGSELTTNGDMETGDPPTGWLNNGVTALTADADSHTGSQALKVTLTSAYGYAARNITVSPNTWYSAGSWAKRVSGTSYIVSCLDPNDGWWAYAYSGYQTGISYTNHTGTFRPAGTSMSYRLGGKDNGDVLLFDDVSIKALTTSELFSSITTSDTDVIASTDMVLISYTQGGLVLNLDSSSSPLNYLLAYHDGNRVHLDKVVNGTYTSLIKTTTTYSAEAKLQVMTYHSDANTLKVKVYYNGALVGTEQTVTDAGIISNTLHGLFSTYSGNTFDNFSLSSQPKNYDSCIPGDTSYCGAPVAEWKMDEGTGQYAYDTSGNSNTGTLGSSSSSNSSDPTWAAGKYGKGLKFDGTDDYVSFSGVTLTNTHTVSMWIYPIPSSDTYGNLFSSGTTGFLYRGNLKKVTYFYSGIDHLNDTALTENQWHHVNVVSNSGNATFYIDGKADGTATGALGYTTSRMGDDTYSENFKGLIDQVKIYNYARTAAQVAWDYNRGGPVGWYKLDEAEGTIAYSASGSYNGTTSGATVAQTGKTNYAYTFDGSNDFVDVGTGPTMVNAVSFWVKPTTTTEYFVDLNGSAYISSSGGTLSATGFTSPTYYINGAATASPTLSAGVWTHVTVVTSTSLNATDLDLGRIEGVGYLEGSLDDVRVYNYTLTSLQVKEIYTGGAVQFGQ